MLNPFKCIPFEIGQLCKNTSVKYHTVCNEMYLIQLQIIYKIKIHTTAINMTPNEVCDRIFELVDQNHDGKCPVKIYSYIRQNMHSNLYQIYSTFIKPPQ